MSLSTLQLQSLNNLLICPYCSARIPNIRLLQSEGTINIKVKCKCLTESKIVSLKQFIQSLSTNLIQYHELPNKLTSDCIECKNSPLKHIISIENEWINSFYHIISQTKLLICCHKHAETPFDHYCKQCKEHLCSICTQQHWNEHKDKIMGLQEKKKILKDQIDLTNNAKLIDTFIQRLDLSNEYHQQMMKDIQLAYKVNESINQDLILLRNILANTDFLVLEYPIYEIQKSKYIVYNNTQYNKDESMSIEATFQSLLHYFTTQFIFKEHKPYILSLKHTMNCDYSVFELFQITDNQLLFICQNSKVNKVCIYDLSQNTLVKQLYLEKDPNELADSINMLKDGRLILTYKTNIKIWDLNTNQLIEVIQNTMSTCFSELTDHRIAIGFQDGLIKIYNISSYQCTKILSKHQKSVTCIIYMDGEKLASSSDDCTIKIWNIQTSQCITTIIETNKCKQVFQSNNGELVAYILFKGLHLWNLKTFRVFGENFIIYHQTIYVLKDGRLAFSSVNKIIVFDPITHESEIVFQSIWTHFDKIFILKDGRFIVYSNHNAWIYDIGMLDIK